ncbi:galactose-specific lectin nattectin-like [Austrofundulus limnaeus]|uniref:Galactose-specific lectin nattectin-like n=1 Tax=Austrofundulus limnaeus TaxID=52670 RepID=A0A2I4D2R3_AUSLI|nr:PREDICTED: galactose-specific lectin nattectin-like [Austrofundulus limnaeus]
MNLSETLDQIQEQIRSQSSCPSGWTQSGTRCFLFINSDRDWITAERHCIELGGNLASFHDYNQLVFLRNLVYSATRSYRNTWVGGTDAVKDGVWFWSDGSKYDYNNWYRGEPNNAGGPENCMEINFGGISTNDERCTSSRPYICSRKR